MEAPVAHTTLGSSPAISIVPTEILEKIFMSYFEQEVGQYDEKMLHSPAQFDVPMRLGAVCARWRQIVHGMSRLWSFISVKNHEDSIQMSVRGVLELYLERSGVQPLRIAVTNLIEPPHSGIRPSMDSLSPLCDIPLDRVHHLTLKEPIGGDGNIKDLISIEWSSISLLAFPVLNYDLSDYSGAWSSGGSLIKTTESSLCTFHIYFSLDQSHTPFNSPISARCI
ncbi:hypothetical protein CPB86DRAFT_605294 [Serendipita vermifera]|nr:hypothetical protein CPB86DRAFT_605294 [Serendipita vermifera]